VLAGWCEIRSARPQLSQIDLVGCAQRLETRRAFIAGVTVQAAHTALFVGKPASVGGLFRYHILFDSLFDLLFDSLLLGLIFCDLGLEVVLNRPAERRRASNCALNFVSVLSCSILSRSYS
jgi:hypothetical protein